MAKYIAQRRLLFSDKNSKELKEATIRIQEPYVIDQKDVDFSVDGVMAGCRVDIQGISEPGYVVYGMDSLQAINLASNIEPLIERLSEQYDFFWDSGEPYFENAD